MRFIFDVTTSARWAGSAVGIVRVERELARRARLFLSPSVIFSIYSKRTNRFFPLNPEAESPIFEGRSAVDPEAFDASPPPADVASEMALHDLMVADRPAREVASLLRFAEALSVDQALKLRAAASVRLRRRAAAAGPAAPVGAPLELGPDDVVVSGGLDWEHKDIVGLGDLRRRDGFRYVAVVYDLIPLMFPHFVVPGYVHLLRGYFGELFWTADHCLCISETTADDVRRHIARYRLPPNRVESFPLGGDLPKVDAEVADAAPPEIEDRPYALFVSTIEPRKNHRVLYQALVRMVREGDDALGRGVFVFVGRTGWNVDNLMHEIRANPLTRDRVVFLNDVSDAALAALYRNARMVLFPSFYEGYGLPLAEALALGKACVASDAPALVEVAGGRALHLPPDDPARWAGELARLFRDDAALRALERRAAEGPPQPSWDDAAAAFFAAVRNSAAEARRAR